MLFSFLNLRCVYGGHGRYTGENDADMFSILSPFLPRFGLLLASGRFDDKIDVQDLLQ